MLARLRGMVLALKATEEEGEEILPTWDATGSQAPPKDTLPSAAPAEEGAEVVAETASRVEPVELQPAEPPHGAEAAPLAKPAAAPASAMEPEGSPASTQTELPSGPRLCPYCEAPRTGEEPYCATCGWIFPPSQAAAATLSSRENTRPLVRNRYELRELLDVRGNVGRYRGLDHGVENAGPMPVILLRSALPEPGEAIAVAVPVSLGSSDLKEDGSSEATPTFPSDNDPPAVAAEYPQAEAVPLRLDWPSVAWEAALLEQLQHPVLPRVLAGFVEDGFQYLVEELPTGRSLWDAWDDPTTSADQRFAWLKQVAGALYHLNQRNALLEAIRPDIVVVTPDGQPRLTDLSDLLPLPLPPNPPIRATCYTAPELVLASDQADARAGLYSFGAMLYALHVGRELTELDFELQGVPKPFLERFPDVHPLFGRLVSKTFCRDVSARFPTDEAAREDPAGFTELIRTLEDCRQHLDRVRLEIAAWTTTGMVRSGNEDAFALLHAAQACENRVGESALVLLADGMGGYEAGEVAAALAMQVLRNNLLKQQPFAVLAGNGGDSPPGEIASEPYTLETCKRLLSAALQDANGQIYEAARTGPGHDGMGCTAEAVYVDGRHVVVGHVGDSRTYHLHEGRLVQLTEDQTWVQRMVRLGALTSQEAEKHPRRSELQQALGGRPDVEPALYASVLKPGDWILVCSDGLSSHLSCDTVKDLLQAAPSAEWAARRLVNSVNLAGATDNATVVVIRAT
jgi:protein phosphatase